MRITKRTCSMPMLLRSVHGELAAVEYISNGAFPDRLTCLRLQKVGHRPACQQFVTLVMHSIRTFCTVSEWSSTAWHETQHHATLTVRQHERLLARDRKDDHATRFTHSARGGHCDAGRRNPKKAETSRWHAGT